MFKNREKGALNNMANNNVVGNGCERGRIIYEEKLKYSSKDNVHSYVNNNISGVGALYNSNINNLNANNSNISSSSNEHVKHFSSDGNILVDRENLNSNFDSIDENNPMNKINRKVNNNNVNKLVGEVEDAIKANRSIDKNDHRGRVEKREEENMHSYSSCSTIQNNNNINKYKINNDIIEEREKENEKASNNNNKVSAHVHHKTKHVSCSSFYSSRSHSDWIIPSRYEIRHLIGTGSYGHVCESYDRLAKRVVAIKKITRVFDDLIDCKRILREIAILNRLKHTHVVQILDIVLPTHIYTFDELYVVLEIADSDFKKLFRTPVYLSEMHVKTLLYNLLVGVKYIHSCGIFHRDLKPANCLVNQDCSVKICDFGLARTVGLPNDKNTELLNSSHENDEVLGVSHTKNLKRQLTGHVVTRWYRAPELILLQEKYTEAIDIWSIGCIFAELLNMMKENLRMHSDRGPLFPGSSCFPLSPDQKHAADYKFHTRGNRDQLNMIFNVIGTPSEEDIESLEKDDAKKYIRIFTPREGINFKHKFPAASRDAVDLLEKMLVFNPLKRITVENSLSHPLFKDIRNFNVETVATERARLPFDDWENMNEPELRYAFLKEIQRYHPDLIIPSDFTNLKK